MAQRLSLRDMKCIVHELDVMGLKPSQVELEVHSSLLLSKF